MASSNSDLPRRLVICVDGSQYNPSSNATQPNIHRIYASIQRGRCVSSYSGASFNQDVKYVPGIGAADAVFSQDRLSASVLGQGHLKQIQDVYESCCLLSERDEVWMFGFSRGAYVIRAVAGLLHTYGSLATAGSSDFSKDFKKILKEAESTQGKRSSLLLSPITSVSSANIKVPPRIMFVGAFETVRAVNDDLFDISLNSSIRHMRHAVALHEDRKALSPEYMYPEELYGTNFRDFGRSFIQAHFIGQHTDMGGSAKKSGLALYPLQWMLLEARQCGLSIDVQGRSSDEYNPLSVVFPKTKDKKKKKKDDAEKLWSFTTANGVVTNIQDLREVHGMTQGNEMSYAIKLNSSKLGSMRAKKSREPFTKEGFLRGYCDWASQGTIIHPSVYLLLDEHINIALETKELRLQRHIEDWRDRMLGTQESGINTGFWLDGDDEDNTANPGAIRVLVCGNTGVGKSTLINKTFGVDVTTTMHRMRGIHDVREEMTFEGRPDLIVHDSGGFEAGTDDEFLAIEGFLKEKSASENLMAKVHVIWFAVDINSSRTLQTATEKLFHTVSLYAKEVPIVVVATKKDEFLDIEFGIHRKTMKKEGKRFDEEECEKYAEERLQERIETIRKEMETVPNGRLDACIAVSQDDDESIAALSKTTSHCFDTDKVRLLYIRAQVTRIDLKMDLALSEISKRYKKMIKATGANFAPMGATLNRKISQNQVMKSIINCFGLPTVSADVALKALSQNCWSNFGSNVQLALAEAWQLIGCVGTGFSLGIPVWLITGGMNSTYVVPTTCRLFLIMACDLTLVLARSFKEVTFRASGQPNAKDVGAAARNYAVRGYAQHVHREVKRLIPKKNPVACYKAEAIERGVENIFISYKDRLMSDVDLPLKVAGLRIGSELDDDASTQADSSLFDDMKDTNSLLSNDVKDANSFVSELDGGPVTPLPVELDAGEKDPVELPANPFDEKRAELPA